MEYTTLRRTSDKKYQLVVPTREEEEKDRLDQLRKWHAGLQVEPLAARYKYKDLRVQKQNTVAHSKRIGPYQGV